MDGAARANSGSQIFSQRDFVEMLEESLYAIQQVAVGLSFLAFIYSLSMSLLNVGAQGIVLGANNRVGPISAPSASSNSAQGGRSASSVTVNVPSTLNVTLRNVKDLPDAVGGDVSPPEPTEKTIKIEGLENMKIELVGADGKPVKSVQTIRLEGLTGKPGHDGTNGQPGKDGRVLIKKCDTLAIFNCHYEYEPSAVEPSSSSPTQSPPQQ